MENLLKISLKLTGTVKSLNGKINEKYLGSLIYCSLIKFLQNNMDLF